MMEEKLIMGLLFSMTAFSFATSLIFWKLFFKNWRDWKG